MRTVAWIVSAALAWHGCSASSQTVADNFRVIARKKMEFPKINKALDEVVGCYYKTELKTNVYGSMRPCLLYTSPSPRDS